MSNELITQSEGTIQPGVLAKVGEEVVLIQPVGCAGSDHCNVIPHGSRTTRGEPMLFIGGPLDGQTIRVPADGRMYDYVGALDFDRSSECRYCPSIISFDGQRRMVYIMFERIRPVEKPYLNEEQRDYYQKKIDRNDRRITQTRYIESDYEL